MSIKGFIVSGQTQKYDYDSLDNLPDAPTGTAYIAPTFSSLESYAIGDYVFYEGELYRFTSAHSSGAWDSSHVVSVELAKDVENLNDQINGGPEKFDVEDINVGYYANNSYSSSTNYRYGFLGDGEPKSLTVNLTDISDSANIEVVDVNKTFVRNIGNWKSPGTYDVTLTGTEGYVRVSTKTADISKIYATYTSSGISQEVKTLKSQLKYLYMNTAITNYLKQFLVYGCTHTGNGTYNLTNMARTTLAKRCCFPFNIRLSALNGYKIAVQTFNSSGAFVNGGGWETSVDIPSGTYFQFIADTNSNSKELFSVEITSYVSGSKALSDALALYDAKIYFPPLINQTMTPLTVLNTCPQSFDYDKANNRLICYYNSTNLFAISLTNGNSTTLSSTMDCGHGNCACYDSINKLFYVFGWDTPYITPINLTSTPVLGTPINTGLSGYLSGAIDFENNIAYILQRTTYPDTEEYYNFIAFDIQNSAVISTAKTGIKMLAVQDCKFKDGLLFCNWGVDKSHLSVFDTSGRCVYSYENTTAAYPEPEALAFVDDDIYVSSYLGNLQQVFKLVNKGNVFT